MDSQFLQQLLLRQKALEPIPENSVIATWALKLLDLLFPERTNTNPADEDLLQLAFLQQQTKLESILKATKACDCNDNTLIAASFFVNLPNLHRQLRTDLSAILEGDPAAKSEFEIIRCYPGFLAICLYRIAHQLYLAEIPLIPRILTEYAHSVTGIDIHPGATIGDCLYIDHGTGLVIGETTVIGNRVKLYQGVTLGALSVDKLLANVRRHPTIGDNVIIYSGATILGGETVIGNDSIIGGNVWLTKSVPAGSIVYHQAEIKISETKKI